MQARFLVVQTCYTGSGRSGINPQGKEKSSCTVGFDFGYPTSFRHAVRAPDQLPHLTSHTCTVQEVLTVLHTAPLPYRRDCLAIFAMYTGAPAPLIPNLHLQSKNPHPCWMVQTASQHVLTTRFRRSHMHVIYILVLPTLHTTLASAEDKQRNLEYQHSLNCVPYVLEVQTS